VFGVQPNATIQTGAFYRKQKKLSKTKLLWSGQRGRKNQDGTKNRNITYFGKKNSWLVTLGTGCPARTRNEKDTKNQKRKKFQHDRGAKKKNQQNKKWTQGIPS